MKMEMQSPRDHIREAQMILEDMQRPVEMRYSGAQAHAMLAIAKMMLTQMGEDYEEDD